METEKKVDDLQELINKKAERRLKDDLKSVEDFINSSKILTGKFEDCDYTPKLSFLSPEKDVNGNKVYQTDSIGRLLNADWGVLRNEMWDNYLPIYIAEETQNFMNRVNNLQDQIDDLKNGMPQDY